MTFILEVAVRLVCLAVVVSWPVLAAISLADWIGELRQSHRRLQGPPDMERIP